MDIEKFVNSFPECEKVKKEDIRPILTNVLSNAKNYHDIFENIMEEIGKLYPRNDSSEEYRKERYNYLYGSGYDENWNYINPLGDWINTIQDEYIYENGKAHNILEAVDIAAKKWVELIFGFHIQDNGALGESHGGGFPACAFGTILKDKSLERLEDKEKISDKTYELIKEFYLNNRDKSLSVDYGPCKNLHDILVSAGVNEKETSNICPWKTMISIDKRDNSVAYHTYGRVDYI